MTCNPVGSIPTLLEIWMRQRGMEVIFIFTGRWKDYFVASHIAKLDPLWSICHSRAEESSFGDQLPGPICKDG